MNCIHGASINGCPACMSELIKQAEKIDENALWHKYAAAALEGIVQCPEWHKLQRTNPDQVASDAADYADAMIEEARKRGRV